MTRLKPHTPRAFIIAGMVIALGFLSLSIFGFQLFRTGYWNAEPIALAMYVTGSLIALWLATGRFAGWLEIVWPRGNPLLTLWLLWLFWQALVTVYSPNIWLSWTGPPEQGEGLGWYLCASLFMLMLAALWPSLRRRQILLGWGFALMLFLAFCHLVSDENNNMFAGFMFPHIPDKYFAQWLPFVWPDYIGYIAGWWWIALMLGFPALRLRILIPIGLCMLVVLIASSNHAALLLMSYAILINLTVRIVQARGLPYFRTPSRAWRRMATLALLLPLLWLLCSPAIDTDYSDERSQSIPTRILLNHMTLATLANEPVRLLFGHGWGQFTGDFFKYGMVRDIHIYQHGVHKPNSQLIRGYNYHSHNMAAETLLALGLPGFLLWLFMPIVAIWRLPASRFWHATPMLIAVTWLSHMWFAMPQTMPFQALCWFLLLRETGAKEPEVRRARPQRLLLLAAAGVLLWSANIQWEALRYSTRLSDPFGRRYGEEVTAEYIAQDIPRGGDRLRAYFISTTKRIIENQPRVEAKHIRLYHAYLDAMEEMARAPRIGAYNGAAVLYGYNVLISGSYPPIFTELQLRVSQHYVDMALLHSRRTPLREDVIAPFMKALYDSPRDIGHQALMELVQQLLAINPRHRSALWVGGKVLAGQPGMEASGREMMRAALRMHADRIYPIPDAEIDALSAAP